MPLVLTEASNLDCAHLGTVQLTATQSKLIVAGAKVLVDGDLSGASIGGCKTLDDASKGMLHCAAIASAVGGISSKLIVSGKGALLDTISGQTTGTVSGIIQTWSVQSAGQSQLKAL